MGLIIVRTNSIIVLPHTILELASSIIVLAINIVMLIGGGARQLKGPATGTLRKRKTLRNWSDFVTAREVLTGGPTFSWQVPPPQSSRLLPGHPSRPHRTSHLHRVRTRSWMGPPQGKRAPRVGHISISICDGSFTCEDVNERMPTQDPIQKP